MEVDGGDTTVGYGVDNLFKRLKDEVTKEYPYPLAPVHWMSKHPNADDGYAVYSYKNHQYPLKWRFPN